MLIKPRAIRPVTRRGQVDRLYAFVWHMSGCHQASVILLGLAVAALAVVPLELQRRIVDDAIAEQDGRLLLWLGAIYVASIVVSGSLKFVLRLYEGWLAESTTMFCRQRLAELHYENRDENGGSEDGTAVSIIRAEIEQVAGFVGDGLSNPAANLGTLIAVVGYMLWVEPFIAIASFAFLLPQLALAPIIQSRINRLTESRIEKLRALSGIIADTNGDSNFESDFPRTATSIYANRIAIFAWKFLGKALLNLLNALAPIAVLVIGGMMVIDQQTELGIVVAFTTGFARLSDPLRSLIAYYREAALTSVKHRMIVEWI